MRIVSEQGVLRGVSGDALAARPGRYDLFFRSTLSDLLRSALS